MSASYERCRSEFSNKSRKFVSYIRISSKRLHAQVTEVMRASNLLYVYVRMHQTIHACRQVSVRVLRTAVRESACCESMKLFITLFYSFLFLLCWERNLLPYYLPPSSRTNILFLIPEKLTKQTIMNALVETIPVTSRGFLKCKGTHFRTSVGICNHCNVW